MTAKQMSVEHEDFIAKVFGGKRERASGANPTRPGDVYVHDEKILIECKVSESNSVTINSKKLDKLRQEAAQRGCRPMAALRLRDPYNGDHIDVVVKLLDDEIEEREMLDYYRENVGEMTF
jgi:Holliday junction resolvase